MLNETAASDGIDMANNSGEKVHPRKIHGWKWATAYTSMLSTTLLFSLDNTIVANLQPSILHALGGPVALLPWIGTGFALGTMAVLPWGKAHAVFDIRTLYLLSIALFLAGSAVCGAAPSIDVLVAGRVVAGVGGAGMYSGTLTYVSVLTGLRERPAYLAGSTVVWGVGSVLGPVVGGAFAISSATWRWGFYINLVVGAVFAPAYLLLFPSIDPQPGKTMRQKCAMIDWVMTVVFLAGSACLTVAISFGGVLYPFNSTEIITLWTVTGVLLIASIFIVKFHPLVAKENRLYPAHFFKNPTVINMQLQVFLSSGIILGDGPLDAGVRLLPLIIFMVVVSMVNGVFMPKLSFISPWYIGGSSLVFVGSALMYTVRENTRNANIYGYSILIGAGAGCYIVAGFAIVQSLVPVEDIANAVGAMTIAQDLGMVLFLASCGAVFHNTAIRKVGSVLPDASAEEIGNLIAGTSSSAFQALSDAEKDVVVPQIADAMTSVWALFLAAAALSFVFSLPLVKTRLGRAGQI